MVQINPGDLPDLPVEQLAQFLLGCAREDPTLLARSNSGPVVRRDTEVRVPVGKPIDLTATQADAMTRPVEQAARQVARPANPPAPKTRPVGPEAPPIVPPMQPRVPRARPIVPLATPIVPRPMPIVPPIIPAGAPAGSLAAIALPTEALPGQTAASAEQVDPAIRQPEAFVEPAGRSVMPDAALSGPLDPSTRSAVLTARPAEALAGPSARPSATSPILVDRVTGPIDATARLVAKKLQLRRPDARDDPELEELVSIAVACARRAEDAVQQAREISWMARRRMSVVGVVGAGVLAASAVGVLDRYHATGELAQPGTASAFLAAPVTADPVPRPVESVPQAETSPAPSDLSAAGRVSEPAKLADRLPVPDAAKAVTEMSPPVIPSRSAPVTDTAASRPPASANPAAASAVAAASPPAGPPAVGSAAAAESPPANAPARASTAAPPPARAAVRVSPPVVAVPPPANVADSAPPPARVAEARAPLPSPSPTPLSTGHSGNSSAAAPAASTIAAAPATEPASVGQQTVESASLDALPLQAAPQAPHPVRHARRAVRRVFYYPPGPGLLLAQVVYGVRRNLYEIFH
jgi:hypothetical protein